MGGNENGAGKLHVVHRQRCKQKRQQDKGNNDAGSAR
jgi:hypothetical protein